MTSPSIQAPSRRKFYPFAILWVVLYLVCLCLTCVKGIPIIVGDILTFGLGIPLTVLVVMDFSSHIPGRKTTLFIVLAALAWWIATMLLVRAEFDWRIWHSLNTVTLLCITFTLGLWLAGELEKAGHMILLGILGMLVDVWSVFQGPSKNVGQAITEHVVQQFETGVWHPPPVVEFLLLSWPQPGSDFIMPLLGFGDLVFIAIFLGGARRFGLSIPRTVFLLLAGLAHSFALAFYFQIPIPALPFICGFFIIGNFRNVSVSRKEWILTLVICGVVIIIGLLNWLINLVSAG